ncbi:serine/threonine protein kinase [Paraliomyxa miuraensis]|uniref:serine/threonine protein kinase n=1 Tax=Paraliomyxa miuraensis TaxID=376150 RepID=UPI0022541F98|nr:serine/threonine-protein kinase [Paraliomyxa miuraensis]MCX4239631.1 serine/threonine protein kinase [Paraliomyxa miuraensis]
MAANPSLSDGLEPGTVVDARYRICQEIGRGNMGTVYRATDELTGREVAIKIMSRRLVHRRDRVQRFLNEYELSVKVGRHENIVATLAQGRLRGEDGAPYLVMERIVGPSLDILLAMHRRLDPQQACSIALGIARGVEAMHRARVVHRDIKPSNVMVSEPDDGSGGVAKILDFGLATVAKLHGESDPRPRLTLHEQIPGSSGYMAPEVANHADPHPSVDVFGFGMLLVELLTGRTPHEGMSRDEYLVEVTREDWALPPAMLDQIESDELKALVVACTQRRPEARPTMTAVVRALVASIDRHATAMDPMAATNPRIDEETEPTGRALSPAPRWRRGLNGWLVASVVMVVLAGGLGGTLLLPSHAGNEAETGEPPPPEPQPWSASPTLSKAGDGEADGETATDSGGSTSPDVGTSDTTGEDDSSTGADDPALGQPRPRARQERAPVQQKDRQRGKQAGADQDSADDSAGGPASNAAECELLQDSISAMRAEGGWSRILFLIKDQRACFGRAEYRRLRVEALARSGKHDECIKAGADSDDPQVVAWVDKCKEMGR